MKQLLVINPNTSERVSALLQTHVQTAAGLHVQVRTVTARFGAPYIADEASYAVAAHAALDAWAAALAGPDPAPDAVLIGCFGDPGLMALRESSPAPVTGLAEAAFIEEGCHDVFDVCVVSVMPGVHEDLSVWPEVLTNQEAGSPIREVGCVKCRFEELVFDQHLNARGKRGVALRKRVLQAMATRPKVILPRVVSAIGEPDSNLL